MLPITGYAPLNGWRQVGAPHWAYMSAHTFEASPAGELLHYTDGVLRARIAPEGFEGYLEAWPMAQPIVDAITGKKAAPRSPEAAAEPGPAL